MRRSAVFILFILMLPCFAQSQTLNIIPEPAKVEVKEGVFTITPSTKIITQASGVNNSINFLNNYFKKYYGFELKTSKNKTDEKNAIVLNYARLDNSIAGAYNLNVDQDKIYIEGNDEQGVFCGIQTLIQLLPAEKVNTLTVQQCNIVDSPRFAYRGLHLDCGRHFFSVDFVKQYIDFIAMHKMNTFHWHLTEDQGWRIEIKKYPKLTQVGGCRNGTIIGHHPGTGNNNTKYCGYYTQQQIKDVVKYAAERYITIIPEIELPGHSSAAIAAYPQLSCFPNEPTAIAKGVKWSGDSTGKQVQQSWGVYPDVFCPSDYTFKFLENVLDEVMALFPSKYIHIGGDECPKEYWKRSEFCQSLIKEKGLKDEHGLQSYFISTIEKYLNSKGRQIIGWDEILEGGLAPNATVMSWRGEQGGIEAAKQHHKVIMTPGSYVYFNYAQSKKEDSLTIGGYLPVETVYNYEPQPKELSSEEQKYIIGAQANLWSEYITNSSNAEYLLFPRLDALSEVLWSPQQSKNWEDFKNRLQQQYKRYDLWNVHYNTKGINKGE
jgi:hexosaminidase